jgi:cobalt-zinc-cadmium efflux system outer membrane protein
MLVAEVRAQYGVAAAAIRAVAVADDLVNAAQRQFDIVRARVEAGAAPPLERDLLDVEVRRLDATRLLAIGRADAALVQLKPLLGMSPADVLTLRDTFDALVALSRSAFPGTEVQTVGARSDVREADARVALADARIDEARREGRLDFNLFGRYTRMDAGFPQLGIGTGGSLERVRGQFNYLSAGATVSVPLRDRNQGMVAAARAERVIAVARHEAVVLAASADLAAAQARSAQAQRAVALYDTGVRELASRNLDVVRQAFELGRATIYDVLAEQRRFLEVEEGYLAVARETWDAYIALSRAQGEQR